MHSDPSELVVAFRKSCCAPDWRSSVNLSLDSVNGGPLQNVLTLTAIASDNACPGPGYVSLRCEAHVCQCAVSRVLLLDWRIVAGVLCVLRVPVVSDWVVLLRAQMRKDRKVWWIGLHARYLRVWAL